MERGPDGITCVFFCHDGEGNFVMHKRSQNCRDEKGRWDVGGGAVRFREHHEDTVRREIMEEYGATPLNMRFIDIQTLLREEDGRLTHWVALIYIVRVNRNEVKINDPEKMDEIGWFRKDSWPAPLHSQFIRCLEVVQRDEKKSIDEIAKRPWS